MASRRRFELLEEPSGPASGCRGVTGGSTAAADSGSAHGEPAPTPTLYRITNPSSGAAQTLILAGERVLTNDLVQTFPSARAAREHLRSLFALRRAEGCMVSDGVAVSGGIGVAVSGGAAVSEVAVATRVGASDGVAVGIPAVASPEGRDTFEVEDRQGAWTVTYGHRGEFMDEDCERLLDRIARGAPTRLQLVDAMESPGSIWERRIVGRRLPSIRSLVFDVGYMMQARQANNSLGDLMTTLEACPSLEQLFFVGHAVCRAGSHETLRQMYLLGDPLTVELLEALGSCQFPRLERLALSLASDASPASGSQVAAMLSKLGAPSLREVHIEGIDDIPLFLTTLAEDGVPAHWATLSLCGTADENALLDVLRRGARAFQSLGVLGLPFVDEMSSHAEEALRALLPAVRDSSDIRDNFSSDAYHDWPS